MILKKKTCAGWDGNSHPAFIWKKIDGKSYCKACTFRIEPPKTISKTYIKKITDKQKDKNIEKKKQVELRKEMFLNIWNKLERKNCWSCDAYLGEEPSSIFFDHLLEKSDYPKLDLVEENIYICCGDCHTKKTMGNPTEAHKNAIEQAKIKFKNE